MFCPVWDVGAWKIVEIEEKKDPTLARAELSLCDAVAWVSVETEEESGSSSFVVETELLDSI